MRVQIAQQVRASFVCKASMKGFRSPHWKSPFYAKLEIVILWSPKLRFTRVWPILELNLKRDSGEILRGKVTWHMAKIWIFRSPTICIDRTPISQNSRTRAKSSIRLIICLLIIRKCRIDIKILGSIRRSLRIPRNHKTWKPQPIVAKCKINELIKRVWANNWWKISKLTLQMFPEHLSMIYLIFPEMVRACLRKKRISSLRHVRNCSNSPTINCTNLDLLTSRIKTTRINRALIRFLKTKMKVCKA